MHCYDITTLLSVRCTTCILRWYRASA